MSSLPGSPTARYIFVAAVVLVTFWVWRQPFQSISLHPAPPSLKVGYRPKKLYESDAKSCNDNAAGEAEVIVGFEQAAAIPAFKDSAKVLPSDIYNPYPEYNSPAWRKKWKGTHAACKGPRGVDVNEHEDDMLVAHRLETKVMRPFFSSFNESGLESDFCFDRYARYDPYGYDGDGMGAQNDTRQTRPAKVKWDSVNWGGLQQECYSRNEDRYEPFRRPNGSAIFRMPSEADVSNVDETLVFPPEQEEETKSYRIWQSKRKDYKERSAIVLRTWEGNEWTVDTIQFIRTYIMELALHSGAEYEVIILVEVKDIEKPIFSDLNTYNEVLKKSVPNEFKDMAILFNRNLLEKWYPKVGAHDPKTSQVGHMNQPLQLLSLLRPDIDHFWQVELDVRYTGHHYHHLETISTWAKTQPRKLQWERASQYYIPAIHGSWSNFTEAIANRTKDGGIWGAVRTQGVEPVGPQPPTESPNDDSSKWGVGEEADFINLAPVFDVAGSGYIFKDAKDHYPEGKKTPAQATATSALTRVSKRLLRAMHHGQINLGLHMFPEMYPESTALHHGLKIVVFPLPMYLDYAKLPELIERHFNDKEGRTLMNVPYQYSDVWHRMSYWANIDKKTTFGDELYKRWLAYSGDKTERLCLPGLLLHPIKGV